MYELTTITPPAVEPVSLELAKLHLAIGHNDEDLWVNSAIKTARDRAEKYTGQRWINQVVRLVLADFPECLDPFDVCYDAAGRIRIPIEPVSAIASVKYVDDDGDEQTIDAADYQTWLGHSPPLVAPAPAGYWPIVGYGYLGAVRVQFTAGYGATAASVPEAAKTAMLICLAAWYENRADQNILIADGLPPGARALLDLYWTGSVR